MSNHEHHAHGQGDHGQGDHGHGDHGHGAHGGGLNAMAASATLHCLTGCAIGEVLGLMIGTAAGFSTTGTLALAVGLAFLFGYTLSTLPLLKAGLGFRAAVTLVLAADTLSIATMEVVDNAVMAVIPGAMDAGLVNPTFWISMPIALAVAYVVAFPVNRFLLQRGRGHALTHEHHGAPAATTGFRRLIPSLSSGALAAALAAFALGGLTVAIADDGAEPEHSVQMPAGH